MPYDLSEKDSKALSFIRNRILHSGKNPTLREINEVTGGKSPRSAALIVERLIKAKYIRKVGSDLKLTPSAKVNTHTIKTINVPLVGSVPCGTPMLAEENIETYIPISTALATAGSKYFLLRATGTSMNEARIQDGDILLVREQPTADNGQRVVALINDEATVKILERTSEAIILKPKSSDPSHKPIIVTEECLIQGVVLTVLPANLY